MRLAAAAAAAMAISLPPASPAQEALKILATPMRAAPSLRMRLTELGGRQGLVRIRPELLSEGGPVRRTAALRLFPDLALEVELERRSDPGVGPVWVGGVIGDPLASVQLRRSGGSVAGSVTAGGRSFLLLPLSSRRAVVVETEPEMLPPDRALPLPDRLRTSPPAAPPSGSGDREPRAASTIDLLVVIEREVAREVEGQMAWLKEMIRTGVVDTNTALANSGVDAQVRLLKIKRDRYPVEGGDGAFASRLLQDVTDPTDRHLAKTQRLREKLGADLVAVIMRRNTELCGLAWLAGARAGVQPDDADGAFSLTAWRCLINDTLAHELGHNMGAQHSRFDPISSQLGAYDYSFGHRVVLKFRTLMTYRCDFCTPVLHYSNPDVVVDGSPTGVASGSEAAANAWGFERDRDVVAAFRPCRVQCQ